MTASDLRGQLQRTLGSSYTLERELGGGGMSRVFVAEETALARKVVVKVLPLDLAAGVSVERFNREILVAAKLQHAHIVPVLSAGETDGLPYYTMPFVEGESLRARLSRTNGMPITEIIGILRDVAKALAFAHERGVVHRDIKPDNVLLAGGSAAVTDFGIAKAISAARTGAGNETLTQHGTSIGTPMYMAPEQAAADPSLDHRADIYSLGCTAYELLAGRPPFHEKTPQKLLAAHMGEDAVHVGTLRPDCPPLLADVVMRCLAKNADDRPRSASDIVRVLETVASGGSQPAIPATLLGARGMLGKALAAYAVAFALVAVLAKAAIAVVGLPDWVFPGALVVMALGLPVILFTGYVHYSARRVLTATPAFTPGGTPSLAHGTMATIAVKASPHLSWRRAALGGGSAIAVFTLIVGAFMALRALGIGPAGSLFANGTLSSTDAIVVADFDVKGGTDSSLGTVLSEAVRTDLGQSRVLSVAGSSVIAAGLQRMQKPATSRLTPRLARELAQRENMKAVVEGELTPLGGGFIVTTRIVNAATGDELAAFRETASSPTDLLPIVDKLARRLRAKAGESLKAVRATPSLAQVTTPSLEALRKYTDGARFIDYENDFSNGIPLLKEAVAADSAFGMAWRKLAVAYANARLPGGEEAATNAYRFRDRLPEAERLATIAYYYYRPGHDRAKAIAAYEAMVKAGTKGSGIQNLGLLYESRREYARAESVYKIVINAGGAARVSYTNLARALYAQGKIVEAESFSNRADSLFPNANVLGSRYAFLVARDQLDSALRLLSAARTHRDQNVRAAAYYNVYQIQLLRGQLAAAARTNDASAADERARGTPVGAFGEAIRSAYVDTWYREQHGRALRTLDSAIAANPDHASSLQLAVVYANAGRPDRARRLLTEYTRSERDTALVREQAPDVRNAHAQILLADGHALEALAEFRASHLGPDGPVSCEICSYIDLAQAFDRANMPDSAIAYYERYRSTPSLNRLTKDAQFLAGTLKRLGELYEAKGERQKAASAYTRFVDLWKDADPELQPKVADVRRRLVLLSRAEGPR